MMLMITRRSYVRPSSLGDLRRLKSNRKDECW